MPPVDPTLQQTFTENVWLHFFQMGHSSSTSARPTVLVRGEGSRVWDQDGNPSAVSAKVPAQAQSGAIAIPGNIARNFFARVWALAPMRPSRRFGSAKSSSSPPSMARPSGVVRR